MGIKGSQRSQVSHWYTLSTTKSRNKSYSAAVSGRVATFERTRDRRRVDGCSALVEEKVGLKHSGRSHSLCKHSLGARGLALHNEDYWDNRSRLIRRHLTFKLDLKQCGDSVLKQVNETVAAPQEVIYISLHYNAHRRIQTYDSAISVLMKT